MILLSVAVATLILVLNQGTRRFWFESDMIVWCTAACIGACAGFAFLARFSPLPIIAPRLLLTRKFGIPIGLNLAFRTALVVTAYLVPQFLAVVQGYRPLEVAKLAGTTMGVGLVSHFAIEREKYHSNVITENVSLYDAFDADRVARLAEAVAARLAEDAGATTQAIALLAGTARREAWVLSFGDAFLLVAAVLLVSAIGVVAIGRSPPLRHFPTAAGEES